MKEKKPMTKTQKKVTVITLIIFGVILIFCSIMAINEQFNKNTKISEKNNYSLNEPLYCENGLVSITVNNIVRKDHSAYSGIRDGDELIAIYVTVKNGKDSDYSFSENSFQLINSNGEAIKPLYGTIQEMWEGERLNNVKLVSGGKKEGYIVFKNNIVNDNNISLRFNCDSSWITSSKNYKTINVQ